MNYKNFIKLGVNHHLLYVDRISDPKVHEETLETLINDDRFEVIDLWIPEDEPFHSRAMSFSKKSKKEIIYNIGTRKGQKSANPGSSHPADKQYALDFFKRELNFAKEINAAKVVVNSGPNHPDDRKKAIDNLFVFFLEICRYVPEHMTIMIEPTDWDVDKCKLIGSSREAVDLAKRIHQAGCSNFSSMVDMGHLPLMHETIDMGMKDSAGFIGHIHLGNCILKNTRHPLFGDKHVALGLENSEYGLNDLVDLISIGLNLGYFSKDSRGTASFEMRPFPGVSPEKSLDTFLSMFHEAWETAAEKFGL
jgi:hypothetical protein